MHSYLSFSLVFGFVSVCSYKLDFTRLYGVSLNVERIYYFDIIQLDLCMRECEKRMNCSSINFDIKLLQCNLSSTSHLDGGQDFIHATDRIYASINSREVKCSACLTHESCIGLSSGEYICIATECSNTRPLVTNAIYHDSFDPPFLKYTCNDEYIPTGSSDTATCVPGQLWSNIDLNCDVSNCSEKEYIVANGTVTWSSRLNSRSENYELNSRRSWTPSTKSTDEWIQVVFPSVMNIYGVVTQGKGNSRKWVTSYNVSYHDSDASTWILMKETFPGNSDQSTMKVNNFDTVIMTTGIRLTPLEWQSAPSLRFDVLGCSP